jgi:hypothetical protein
MRKIIFMASKPEVCQPQLRGIAPLDRRQIEHFESELDVLDGVGPWQQAIVPKHDRHLAAKRIEIREPDRAR